MKAKILLTTLIFLFGSHFTFAQYLVSSTQIAVRNESQVQDFLMVYGFDTDSMQLNGVKTYKITYSTTDVFGNPTIASGALYVPQLDCNELPFVSFQHGTEFEKLSVPSTGRYTDRGLMYSGNGYITTLPDYLGLGDNPGIHPYIHWESEATASIDLIRAAREFLNDSLQIWDNDQLFIAGYSQGGHSTMAIHKYITDNNLKNEFNIVGSVPMSGPYPLSTDIFDMVFGGDATYYAAEFIPYLLASFQLVYGNLYTSYQQYYDPPYATIIELGLSEGGSWYNSIPSNMYNFMQDSVVSNILNNPNHAVNIALRKNDLHNWIPMEPVRMVYCGMDSMVVPQCSITAKDTMIALGAPDVDAINLDPDADHNGCFIPALVYALDWFDSLREPCVWTSIPSVKNQPEISLYPNPVNDIATFSSAEITSFELYNMRGALIARRNDNTIDMSGMKPGIYFVIGFDKHNKPLYKGKIIKD